MQESSPNCRRDKIQLTKIDKMDKIIIHDAEFRCNIGVTQEERKKKQKIIVGVVIFANLGNSFESDSLDDTIDYTKVHQMVKNIVENSRSKLIETLAGKIAKEILEKTNAKETSVTIKKPGAMASRNVRYASVEVTRKK